jgi:hypothetical protein
MQSYLNSQKTSRALQSMGIHIWKHKAVQSTDSSSIYQNNERFDTAHLSHAYALTAFEI